MRNHLFLKIFCSLPIILIFMYFIPFIGICLLLFRFFLNNKKIVSTLIFLVMFSIFLLSPIILNTCFNIFNISIDYISNELNNIIYSNLYITVITYSKFILSSSIILFILYFILNKLFSNFISYLRKMFLAKSQAEYEINKQNDLEIKLKQERAKNMHVVYCPYCGANNILTQEIGICKFCRKELSVKNNS